MRKVERQLRERVKAVEEERDKITEDRDRFRRHFAERFRWWIKLIGEQKSPSLPYLVETDARFLHKAEWWIW